MDVTAVAWRTSGDNGGTCVEVGTSARRSRRDSNHPNGPRLAFPASTWKAFTNQLKAACHIGCPQYESTARQERLSF